MRGWMVLIGLTLLLNLGLFLYGVRGDLPRGSAMVETAPGRGIIRIAGEDREPPFVRAPLDLKAMHERANFDRPLAQVDTPDERDPPVPASRTPSSSPHPAPSAGEPPPRSTPATVATEVATAGPGLTLAPPPPAPAEPDLTFAPPPASAESDLVPEAPAPAPPVVESPVPLPPPEVGAEPTQLPPAVTASPEVAALQPSPAPPRATTAPPLVTPLCGELSIFGPGQALEAAIDWLEAGGFEVQVLAAHQSPVTGYWVLIPPVADRSASLETVRRLKAAGVDDVWRFSKGDWRNAVSLGLFTGPRNAEKRRAEVAAKGFDAEVRPRFEGTEAYRLEYRASATAIRSEDIEEHFVGRLNRPMACDT